MVDTAAAHGLLIGNDGEKGFANGRGAVALQLHHLRHPLNGALCDMEPIGAAAERAIHLCFQQMERLIVIFKHHVVQRSVRVPIPLLQPANYPGQQCPEASGANGGNDILRLHGRPLCLWCFHMNGIHAGNKRLCGLLCVNICRTQPVAAILIDCIDLCLRNICKCHMHAGLYHGVSGDGLSNGAHAQSKA